MPFLIEDRRFTPNQFRCLRNAGRQTDSTRAVPVTPDYRASRSDRARESEHVATLPSSRRHGILSPVPSTISAPGQKSSIDAGQWILAPAPKQGVALERTSSCREQGISGIEVRSIDYVPRAERHGKTWQQAPFWFAGNFNFFTVAMGFIGPSLGLDFSSTVVAGTAGILFGTLFMALHASQGPDLGLPQMVQSRAQFGYRGVIVPLCGTLFTFVGFNVVDTVLVSQGLDRVVAWNPIYVAPGLAIVAIALAIYGYDWLHRVFRAIFWLSLPFYIVLSGAILHGGIESHQSPHLAFTWVGFAAQFAAGASYNITFAPYVSDYTRYLPRGRSRGALLASVYCGASLSAIWLTALGAWLAVSTGASDGMAAIYAAGNLTFTDGGGVFVFLSVAALAAAMGLNAYSGALTLVTAADAFTWVERTRRSRIVSVLLLAAIWLPVSTMVTQHAIGALYNALSMMLYLLVPWTAINLLDYFLIRGGRYAVPDLFKSDGIYGTWSWRGLTSYAIAFAGSVPFFNLPGLYEGPIARLLGGVDISWAPGLALAATTYLVVMRRFNVAAEAGMIQRSNETLEAPAME